MGVMAIWERKLEDADREQEEPMLRAGSGPLGAPTSSPLRRGGGRGAAWLSPPRRQQREDGRKESDPAWRAGSSRTTNVPPGLSQRAQLEMVSDDKEQPRGEAGRPLGEGLEGSGSGSQGSSLSQPAGGEAAAALPCPRPDEDPLVQSLADLMGDSSAKTAESRSIGSENTEAMAAPAYGEPTTTLTSPFAGLPLPKILLRHPLEAAAPGTSARQEGGGSGPAGSPGPGFSLIASRASPWPAPSVEGGDGSGGGPVPFLRGGGSPQGPAASGGPTKAAWRLPLSSVVAGSWVDVTALRLGLFRFKVWGSSSPSRPTL